MLAPVDITPAGSGQLDPALTAADAYDRADRFLDSALESANPDAIAWAAAVLEQAEWTFAAAVPRTHEGAMCKLRKALLWHSTDHPDDEVSPLLAAAIRALKFRRPEAMGLIRRSTSAYCRIYDTDDATATHLVTVLEGLSRPRFACC